MLSEVVTATSLLALQLLTRWLFRYGTIAAGTRILAQIPGAVTDRFDWPAIANGRKRGVKLK